MLHTESVFNCFFIGQFYFMDIQEFKCYLKNQNYVFVFNLTFAFVFFLQTFIATLFGLFPIFYL